MMRGQEQNALIAFSEFSSGPFFPGEFFFFFLRQEDTRIRFFKIFVLRRIGKKTKLILFLYLDTNPDSFRIRFNFYQIFLDKFFVKTGG